MIQKSNISVLVFGNSETVYWLKLMENQVFI
jgi:hypothetical protein